MPAATPAQLPNELPTQLPVLAVRNLTTAFRVVDDFQLLVCEAYKRDTSIRPHFRLDAAITYDLRTLTYKDDRASLLTLAFVSVEHCVPASFSKRACAYVAARPSLLASPTMHKPPRKPGLRRPMP